MVSAGVWGVIPQSEGVAALAIEKVNSHQSNQISDSDTTGTPNGLDKDRRDDEVTKLARQLTLHSVQNPDGSYPNPFLGSNDPALDPRSGQFNPAVWTKTLLG